MIEMLVKNTLKNPMAAAMAHQGAGGRVIGYVGSEIPVELILAANAMPVQLSGFPASDITLADKYLEDSFAPSIQVLAEHYLNGSLDFLEAIIFPRSNDSTQRLYYYLCELQRIDRVGGPTPLIYDLAKIPRDSSRVHNEQATLDLAAAIGTEEVELPKAIGLRNRRRELLAAVNSARIRQKNLQGSFIDQVFRTADLVDGGEFDAALSEWLQENRKKKEIPGPRLLLIGNAPSDERLHRAVEMGGGNVVAEFGDFAAFSAQLPPVDEEGSFAALATHYSGLIHGPRAFVDRAQAALSHARDAAVDGVIQWLIEQEEALVWDVPAQKAEFAAAGIPVLSLVRRKWDASDGALDEIISFTRSLRG